MRDDFSLSSKQVVIPSLVSALMAALVVSGVGVAFPRLVPVSAVSSALSSLCTVY